MQEVLLDVEVALNNRPLSYMEDDIQMPTLTPNSMLFVNSNNIPELETPPQRRSRFTKTSEIPVPLQGSCMAEMACGVFAWIARAAQPESRDKNDELKGR
jgi:hypothetical protein